MVLITGRVVVPWHPRAMTRRAAVQAAIDPDATVSLHPDAMGRLGLIQLYPVSGFCLDLFYYKRPEDHRRAAGDERAKRGILARKAIIAGDAGPGGQSREADETDGAAHRGGGPSRCNGLGPMFGRDLHLCVHRLAG